MWLLTLTIAIVSYTNALCSFSFTEYIWAVCRGLGGRLQSSSVLNPWPFPNITLWFGHLSLIYCIIAYSKHEVRSTIAAHAWWWWARLIRGMTCKVDKKKYTSINHIHVHTVLHWACICRVQEGFTWEKNKTMFDGKWNSCDCGNRKFQTQQEKL